MTGDSGIGATRQDPIQSPKLSATGTFRVQNAVRNGDPAAGRGPVRIVMACICQQWPAALLFLCHPNESVIFIL